MSQNQEKEKADPIPEELERDIADPKIPIHPAKPADYAKGPFDQKPRPSNADNTAVDPLGNIHSGSAVPDPVGDTLERESESETREYYPEEILDEDPMLGSPGGIANESASSHDIQREIDEEEESGGL